MKNWFCVVVLGVLTLFLSTYDVKAQGKKHVIQLSGIVLGQDSVSGIPGVHVYVPKAGRGTTTNHVGYFSMPVLQNDSVIFSSVGYERQHYLVPETTDEHITLIIDLNTDTTFLDDVTIMPFPTEQVLKEAVLALNLPIDEGKYENENLDQELLQLMIQTTPLDGYHNYRNFMDTWRQHDQNRYGPPTNPYLNPFNWVRFLRDLKKKKK